MRRAAKKARVNGRKQKKNQSAPRMKKDRKIKNGERQYPVAEKFGKSKAEKLEKYANGDEIGEWIGKEQTATVYSIEGNVVGQYNTYIERIDDVVDALCNEITRLENENMQLSWDVLHIGSLINSLVNEIRTLCN